MQTIWGRVVSGLALSTVLVLVPVHAEDRERLDLVETRTEEIANDLLALSQDAREFDSRSIAANFAEGAAVGFAERGEPRTGEREWILRYPWSVQAAQPLSRNDVAAGWKRFLRRFANIDDVRYKVTGANFDDTHSTATIALKFYIIGDLHDGTREWLKGKGTAHATRTPNAHWTFDRFALTSAESMVGTQRMFSDVSRPAGVSRIVPAVGVDNLDPVFNFDRGAAAGDLDKDGFIDIAVTAKDRLLIYRNRGDGTFKEISTDARIPRTPNAEAPILLDYDNDGDEDIFISAHGKQMLLRNNFVPSGRLTFTDVSAAAHVDIDTAGFSAAAADVNNDGLTDIYVGAYLKLDREPVDNFFYATNGRPNLLFINQGNGTFREAAKETGAADRRLAFGVLMFDADGDGDQDIFISNDYSENVLLLNRIKETGKLRFEEATKDAGLYARGYGMGAAVGDIDNDGQLDVHATYMSSTAGNRILDRVAASKSAEDEQNLPALRAMASGDRLFRQKSPGKYEDVTNTIGPLAAGWAWGGGFIDIDNDGWSDLHIPNGMISGKEMDDT